MSAALSSFSFVISVNRNENLSAFLWFVFFSYSDPSTHSTSFAEIAKVHIFVTLSVFRFAFLVVLMYVRRALHNSWFLVKTVICLFFPWYILSRCWTYVRASTHIHSGGARKSFEFFLFTRQYLRWHTQRQSKLQALDQVPNTNNIPMFVAAEDKYAAKYAINGTY